MLFPGQATYFHFLSLYPDLTYIPFWSQIKAHLLWKAFPISALSALTILSYSAQTNLSYHSHTGLSSQLLSLQQFMPLHSFFPALLQFP